jgi:hypothetical protein
MWIAPSRTGCGWRLLALTVFLFRATPLHAAEPYPPYLGGFFTAGVFAAFGVPYEDPETMGFNGLPFDSGSPGTIKVLILGDSMSLCGFGDRLDQKLRKDPQIKSTFTYMAGGTNPLSWLKDKPYRSIKTVCGYRSIEPGEWTKKPAIFDTPDGSAHTVPKLEDLLSAIQPDVLIMQSGNNLFDLFRDRKTVSPQHAALLAAYIVPFTTRAIKLSRQLRKIYWVAPPTNGRISKEVHDFVVEQLQTRTEGVATVIDSRPLVTYPYKRMQSDQTHFIGAEMNQWADKVFDIIEQDLASKPLPLASVLKELPPAAMIAQAKPADEKPTIFVDAQLEFKSQPIPIKDLLPYRESLVAFVYKINRVIDGPYAADKIVVMHPAHIGLAEQDLAKYKVGNNYALRLRSLEGTAWRATKCQDDSSELDLLPYIQLEDEQKYPGSANNAYVP